MDEAAALKDETEAVNADAQDKEISPATTESRAEEEPDPFGLDALISSAPKKEDKSKGKKESLSNARKEGEEETRRFLNSQRVALLLCLETAAKRYKTPWLDFLLLENLLLLIVLRLCLQTLLTISRIVFFFFPKTV